MADGCFYLNAKKYPRFEFYDGTSIKAELKYSLKHLKNIEKILKSFIQIKSTIRLRENRYILTFTSYKLANILKKKFSIKPGKKAALVDIPKIYKNKKLEKYFWRGFMDCDGMVARNNKKIALEVKSKNLIKSFKEFLKSKGIKYKEHIRIINNNAYYRINILSIFINAYKREIGFKHPRKNMWLLKHLKKDFCKINKIDFNTLYSHGIINYKKAFLNTNTYLIEGIKLLKCYKIKHNTTNVKFDTIYQNLRNKGLKDRKINELLSKFKWKMGKGSKYGISVPYIFNKELTEIAKVIRLRPYCISVSRNYASAMNMDPELILKKINTLFNTKPTFTTKGEPLYCNGALELFFNKAINCYSAKGL